MSKREERKKEKARKKMRNKRCHLCTHWRVLTDEHFPPQSAGNIGMTWAHTINGMMIGQKAKKIAPPMQYANGMKRRSLCQQCNHDTQEWYNSAFKVWTDQARAALPPNADTDHVHVAFKQIEPLAIVKQTLAGALAASDYSLAPQAALMRRVVRNPSEFGVLTGMRVLTYLNPPRETEGEDLALTTKRVCWNLTQLDIENGRRMFTFAEYAHCPLGYVVLFTDPPFGLSESAEGLADLTGFATYGWRTTVDLQIRLPVLNPFGPVSCRFANVKGGGRWYNSEADAEAGIPATAPTRMKGGRTGIWRKNGDAI